VKENERKGEIIRNDNVTEIRKNCKEIVKLLQNRDAIDARDEICKFLLSREI